MDGKSDKTRKARKEAQQKPVAGLQRATRRPATQEELREALDRVFSGRHSWYGVDLKGALDELGFEIEPQMGKPLFVEELSSIFLENKLRLALTVDHAGRWVFVLLSTPGITT